MARSSNRKRKNAVQKKHLNSDFGEILFGALEILAVYTGNGSTKDGKKKGEYAFVRLMEDVVKGETEDEEEIEVEWFGERKKGKSRRRNSKTTKKTILWAENDGDFIPIGAVICAVTGDVVERANNSIEVPDSVKDLVEKKLKKQLSEDENDDEDMGEKEENFKDRMAKLGRIVRGIGKDNEEEETPKKKNGRKIKREESEEKYEKDEGSPKKKRKTEKGSKKMEEKKNGKKNEGPCLDPSFISQT